MTNSLLRSPAAPASQCWGILALAAAVVAVPLAVGGDPYWAHLINSALMVAALATSLDLITGYAGQVSFSHAAFYAVGAYTAGVLSTRLGLGFWVTLPAAIVMTGLIGFTVALPVLRLRGSFLAIATMGVQLIIGTILLKWIAVTRGPMGITEIPEPVFFGITLGKGLAYYPITVGWLLFHLLLLYRLSRSRTGYELLAIREDEDAARAMGVDSAKLKLIAFTVGTALAGGTGAIYAHYMHSIDPAPFDINLSSTLLVMLLLGGRGAIWGGTIGAVLLTLLPEWLRFLQDYRMMIYGTVMILLVLFMPKGLLGLAASVTARIRGARGGEHRDAA